MAMPPKSKLSPPSFKGSFGKNILLAILIFFILASLYSLLVGEFKEVEEITLSGLVEQINAGQVEKITVKGDELEVVLKSGTEQKTKKESEAALTETLNNYGVEAEALKQVVVDVQNPSGFMFWLGAILPFLAPFLLIILFFWLIARQAQRANIQAFGFGSSKARVIMPDSKKEKITFQDVAGVKEAKEELKEVVDFLKNPAKFLKIGARIPKGVLLMGAPGTGKTLLARAVAGEAEVPFFHLSASEFVEMFVGVGASVSAQTPILVKTLEGVKLISIGEFVDQYYQEKEEGIIKPVLNVEALGYKTLATNFYGSRARNKTFFGGSKWQKVQGVYRHKVKEIYEIEYLGGKLEATGDHSVFIRDRNMIKSKAVSDLKPGDLLVNLPFKVRSTFVPGVGTTHKIRHHEFPEEVDLEFDLYGEKFMQELNKYQFALAQQGVMTQAAIGEKLGVSQSTVKNWHLGYHRPPIFNSNLFVNNAPQKIKVTPGLMRLLGYYTAEGRTARYFTQFIFGLKEKELHKDCARLLKDIFKIKPRLEEIKETNSLRISVSSPYIAQFFEKHCGNGSHNKHLPAFIWDLPQKYFLEFLDGYAKGDGYTTKEGKLSITSVSKQLISELAWLCGMHGIQVGIREMVHPAGRIIRKKTKPLPETRVWNLIISKTSHPFKDKGKYPYRWKKPVIKKITKKAYDGYVYDLCGCENEAFFGGEKPILLHNSRVRDLFKMAKKSAPAIIFIDEIDAVGRHRGAGLGGGHDEREQTLNQILVELDGFEPHDQVIVMAATNRPDVLDPALLRPGRFDRRVVLDLPDINDREQILKIHTKNKPLADKVDLRRLAERTPGFSGADIQNLVNEAAILAAREDRKELTQNDLIISIEKVMLGPERKSHILSKKEKEISAYHEAGHALVAAALPKADPVHKVSIVARGRAAGYTLKLPVEDRHLYSRSHFLDELAVALGGYAAEKLKFKELTTGAADDLKKATAIARDLVTRYGMSEKIGPVTLGDSEEMVFLGKEFSSGKGYSETVATMVDAEVSKFMDNAFKTAKKMLEKYKDVLDAIAQKLIEQETLEREEFNKLVKEFGLEPKGV